MPEAHLNVKMFSVTPDALKVIYSACRQCYSPEFAGDIFQSSSNQDKISEFVKKVFSSGHESPLEHVKFTFAVEGISRVCTHQLVRHRIASFSQQSQRYVREEKFDYIMPPAFKDNPELKNIFEEAMSKIQQSYNKIQAYFKGEGKSAESINQDARFLLPGACETKIVVTMNARELVHFFKIRLCMRAQWEIRALAHNMLDLCRRELPAVFEEVDAKCVFLGYCPEGEKFSCGRYSVKEKVIGG